METKGIMVGHGIIVLRGHLGTSSDVKGMAMHGAKVWWRMPTGALFVVAIFRVATIPTASVRN